MLLQGSCVLAPRLPSPGKSGLTYRLHAYTGVMLEALMHAHDAGGKAAGAGRSNGANTASSKTSQAPMQDGSAYLL